jgi:hypothetical protein
MKKILLSILLLLCLCNPVYAQISSMSDPAYLITNGTNNTYISATRMTDTTAIIAFKDFSDFKSKAVVATFSNESWSISSGTYLIAGGTDNTWISATRMTDTTAIIAFLDNSDSKGKAVVATIANGNISMSSPTYIIAGGTLNGNTISATRMTDTTAIIAFKDTGDSNKGKAVVATIANGLITCSNPTYLITNGTYNTDISATRMTDTTAIIAFRDAGDSDNGKAVVATIVNGLITCSNPTYLITNGTYNLSISATRMTDTTAIIAFSAGDGNGVAVVATIANGLITCSNPTYLITNGVFSSDISATRMTDTTAIIAFLDTSALKGKAVVATIANGLITCSNPTYLITNGTNNSYISATRMTDTTAAISFRNITDSSKGTVVMATIGSTPIPGYKNTVNGVIINTINEVIPAKINGI